MPFCNMKKIYKNRCNYNFDPTAPLRIEKDITSAIDKFKKEKADLVVFGIPCQHNLYFSMLEKNGKYFKLSKQKV